MSAFAGIVRWFDESGIDRNAEARLISAVSLPDHARPTVFRAPPMCGAYCERYGSSSSHRPLPTERFVSLFDGRIDDRAPLAARLGVPRETALEHAAFQRWGENAPREMLGEFAWAIWDRARERLMLARDPSASRALYYYRDNALIAFATNIRGLLALPDVPRDIDDQGLAEFLVLHPGKGERTVYRDIRRVKPGTTLVVEAGRMWSKPNWEPRSRPTGAKPAEWGDAAREVFERAVRDRLPAAGPAVVSLSGGLDSSILAGVAAAMCAPQPILGLALVPKAEEAVVTPGWALDGRPQLEALASQHPNLRIESLVPPIDPVEENPAQLFVAAGHPVGLAPNLGWLLGAWRTARTLGARVLLTGDDGEMSLTHGGSLPALVRQGAPGRALLEAWRLARRGRGQFHSHLDIAFFGGRLTWIRRKGARPGEWDRYSPIHPELAEASRATDLLVNEAFPGGLRHRPPGYAETVEIYLRRRAWSVDGVSALRALTGVEHTTPFGDRRVLDFCLSLPESAFVREGRFRWLARTAFRDVLPLEVYDNPVKAEQNAEWFHKLTLQRDNLGAQLESIQSSPLARRALDLSKLATLLDRWPTTAEDALAAGPAYRSTLVRGLHVGTFLRWFDPSNGG